MTLHLPTPSSPVAMPRSAFRLTFGLLLCAVLLGGCERLGIPDPAKSEAQAEADGKAVGSACRHAGRAIEDCFTLNPAAHRAAVFAGWKEMNDYMAENKMAEVAPQLPPPPPPGVAKAAGKAKAVKGEGEADSAKKPADANTDSADADNAGAENAPAAEADAPRKRRRTTE